MTARAVHSVGGGADVLFYVQHLLGIGHLRRAALLARALGRAGLDVVFVTGGVAVPEMDVGGARVAQLPPVRTRDARFLALVDERGREVDEAWKAARAECLLAIFHETRPKTLLIEMFPFGRRQMRFELLPRLEAAGAARPRPRIVSSLRDVLTAQRNPEKVRWIVETFERYFDLVLVHGDPEFLPLERSFPEAREIADKTRYTGYVVDAVSSAKASNGAGEVIVSTGGGAAAGPLVDAAIEARALSPLKDAPWRVLIGHNYPEAQFRVAARKAPDGVIVERARDDFRALLASARLSISQAGYNTLLEVLAAGVPALVVPFAAESETEQTLRAQAFAERGMLTVVGEADLSPHKLATGINQALTQTSPAAGRGLTGIRLRGAEETAEIVCDLAAIVPS